jgi:hypothetical protein
MAEFQVTCRARLPRVIPSENTRPVRVFSQDERRGGLQTVRRRQLTRQVRQRGLIRLHNFGLYVDRVLWGQTVAVLSYDEALRIEHAEHLLVASPCVDDTTRRRITAVAEHGRQQYRAFQVVQLMRWALEIMQTVWRMPPYRRAQRPRRGLRTRQLTLFDGFAE